MKMILRLQSGVFLIIVGTSFLSVTAQINLALHGTVAQETTYAVSGSSTSYDANVAIEGPANNNWEDGCSSTGYQAQTWWGLFLPRLAYITNVKAYYRKDEAHRMNDFRLFFANGSVYAKTELCFRDRKKQAHINLNQSIDCNLSPTRNIYYFNRDTYVELCYIEINGIVYGGCWKGFWGENCTVPCPHNCINQHCHPENGSCIWGCDLNNCSGSCFANTGVCYGGCVLGRAGEYCNKYNLAYNQTVKIIPLGQNNAGLLVGGLVSTCYSFSSTATNSYLQVEFGSLSAITTVHIVFGGDQTKHDNGHEVYCSNITDTWSNGILLYSGPRLNKDITIFAICIYVIYVPPMLNGGSTVELCEIEIGGCPYGKYGVSCEYNCSVHCLGQRQCDLVSGRCLSGCSDGWVGEKCDQACIAGTFGNQCLRNCSQNCLSPPCNHVTGDCDRGCNRGWERLNCTEKCSTGTFGWNCSEKCNGCTEDSCDYISGVCTNISGCKLGYEYGHYCNKICDDFYFGNNCSRQCHCLEKPCNIDDGICSPEGCKEGWHGKSCDKACGDWYFGNNCAWECYCLTGPCNLFTGKCPPGGCQKGWHGVACEVSTVTAENKPLMSTHLGLFIGGFLLGILMATTACFLAGKIRKLRKKQGKETVTEKTQSHEQQHYDDVRMENISTYQDLMTRQTTHDYAHINTAFVRQ